jgi:energy-coupling factor transporter ATP-binding protein EcfA2
MRGVGAITGDHQLRFAPDGLTVIYGQNAVGKSTYVRALKRVCRTVDNETPIRGNVFADEGAEEVRPTVSVELLAARGTHAQQVNLDDPPELGLAAMSVFDARCAELYLDVQNQIAFVPAGLRLLARLAMTQDHMRRDIEAETARLDRAPAFPEFVAGTGVRTLLDGLSAATDTNAFDQLAHLSEEEQRRISELRAALASAELQTARADGDAARRDARDARTLAEQLRELGRLLDRTPREELREHASRARSTAAAVELAALEFRDMPVREVGTDPWQLLWQAARDFALATEMTFPPVSGEHCPLCLQVVSPDAAARLSHLQNHVESSLQAEAARAREALQTALSALDDGHIAACRTSFLDDLVEREPQLYEALDGSLNTIDEGMRRLRDDPASADVAEFSTAAVEQLERWGASRQAHANTVLAALDAEKERALRAELVELEARTLLDARLGDIRNWVGTLKHIAALRRVHAALATNRLTSKQRQLSEQAVTGALENRLGTELTQLRCESVPVALHPETRVGETHVTLRLAGARGAPRVSEIASEGEQRALALAFFLAEVAMSDGDGGIVVDDPVSSLDDERREYIADRLVLEAGRRQVIVFTHDLPFMLDLLDRAEDAGVEPRVQGIWRLGSEVGRVDDHPPFKAMRLKARINKLEEEVAHWDAQAPPRDFDDAWRRVCDFYARLRACWERAVEEQLFKGVVTRLQREVKTRALEDVVVTPELVAMVTDGMTRCSMFVHDEPPATSTQLPDRARLAEEVAHLREFVAMTKKP